MKIHGKKIKFQFLKSVFNTDVVPYYFKAMTSIHEKGQNHFGNPLTSDCTAFVARVEGKIIGLILLSDTQWMNELTVVLGYVDYQYRKHGIYTKLWKKTVKYAKGLGRCKIVGGTHVTNHEMQAVMKKQNRKQTFIMYDYDLTE